MEQREVNNIVTTNATPLVIQIGTLPLNSMAFTDISVTGIEFDTGEAVAFNVLHAGRRVNGGAVQPVGVQTVMHAQKSAGAAAWAASLVVAPGGSFGVQLTGQAGKTITWDIYAETIITELGQ